MKSDPPVRYSKTRVILGTTGMVLGGLAPLVTGIVGIWGYLSKGYFISRTGEIVNGPAGILVSGFFIVAGVGMIAYACRRYRRYTRYDS